MELVPVAGSDDLVDVNYNIKERNANSISGSLGFSDLYGFMIGGRLNMPNVLVLEILLILMRNFQFLSSS